MEKINVGLIGFGTVGSGVVKILQKNSKLIEKRMGAKITLKRIADIDIKTDRGVRLKTGVLTTKADEVIQDPEIDIIIELIGGIEPAKTFILKRFRTRSISSLPIRLFLPFMETRSFARPIASVSMSTSKPLWAVAFHSSGRSKKAWWLTESILSLES